MGIDEQAAFVRRIEEHRGILFKVADSYCRSPMDREDLFQDIVAQLWRSYGRFDTQRNFSTWMYRIALNVAISFYRKTVRHTRNRVAADASLLESIAGPVDDESDEPAALLHGFIGQLNDVDRALMILYLDGNPHATIAEILGISATNVATKISRIKHKLKSEVLDVRTT